MNRFVSLCLLAILVGCKSVPDKSLGNAGGEMRGKTVQILAGPTPSFVLMTGGTMATWGVLGPLASIPATASARSNGDELIRANNVTDPSSDIAYSLAKQLEASKGVVLASPTPVKLQTTDASVINQMYKQADYLLEVDTLSWDTMYNLAGGLRLQYQSQLKLTNNHTGKVISEALCFQKTDSEYGLDELRDNNAAKLKELLGTHKQSCVSKFSALLN